MMDHTQTTKTGIVSCLSPISTRAPLPGGEARFAGHPAISTERCRATARRSLFPLSLVLYALWKRSAARSQRLPNLSALVSAPAARTHSRLLAPDAENAAHRDR